MQIGRAGGIYSLNMNIEGDSKNNLTCQVVLNRRRSLCLVHVMKTNGLSLI